MRYGNPSKKTKTIASTKGQSVEFPGKGSIPKTDVQPVDPKFPERVRMVDDSGIVFVFVPPVLAAEVAAAGMLPETEIEEQDEVKGTVKPEDPALLQKAAFEAFEMLKNEGARESFAGTGVPKPAAVAGLLGYALTNTEVKDLWNKFQLASRE